YTSIMTQIWGPYSDKNNNKILRVNMANIRRKIEENPAEPEYLFTEVGIGYRMREDECKWGQGKC
ncbi:MAG: winged helix-turn-helix domain-containing protein, partial [Lachnoclostridium sp.]|nr:winged helix-turn-helix domain-containing protein [Lachnoclostridium sp.]